MQGAMCHSCGSSSPGLSPRKRESRFVPIQAGTQAAWSSSPCLDCRFRGNDNQSVSVAWPLPRGAKPGVSFPQKRQSRKYLTVPAAQQEQTGLDSCLRRNDTILFLQTAKVLRFFLDCCLGRNDTRGLWTTRGKAFLSGQIDPFSTEPFAQ